MDDNVADDDLQMAVVLGARANLSVRRALLSVREGRVRKRVGGSRPGRRPNRPRDFDLGAYAILRDYFGVDGEPPVYGEDAFEERFRLPRPVFNRLFRAICNEPQWRRTVNATGFPQAHAIQKVSAALRVLGYGEPFDRADEYCRLSRSTIDLYTRRLTHFIIDKWEPTYLRRPNAEELEHILTRNAARGMPGCMGSIDCTHWTWAKCPKALAGQYKDRNGMISVVIETVCDEDLYIWHLFVGCPGAYNDKNVLAASPLMLDVNDGVWPPRTYNYTLNGRSRRLLYYAADQGYPRYALFAQPFSNPDTPRRLVYNRLQEAVRKDAERLYAVWWSRWFITKYPARYMTLPRLINTAKAVAILHNMAVEHRRHGFVSSSRMAAAAAERGAGSGSHDGDQGTSGHGHGTAFFKDDGPNCGAVWGPPVPLSGGQRTARHGCEGAPVGTERYMRMAETEAKDTPEHFSLLNDLAEHVWADRGRLLAPYLRLADVRELM